MPSWRTRLPTAYEKVVDRLLQSPRYGERMAFPWLEAARYADSNGYFRDGARVMWRWRDWVIDAFNRNMPYDQFTIEQLAGDLLPNPTLDQRIATGFNRNHRGNSEAGVIDAEYLVEAVVDRVDTTATVFLGLTMGCARCHNHKYDPLTAKDYYSLFAYFNNLDERGHARRVGNSPPLITAPTAGQQLRLKQLDDELAAANDAFAQLQPDLVKAQQEWEKSLDRTRTVGTVAWGPARGLVAHYPLNGDLSAQVSVSPDGQASAPTIQDGDAQFVSGPIGQAASFDGRRFIQGGDIVGFTSHIGDGTRSVSYDDPYTIAAWVYPTAATGAIVTRVKADNVVENAGVELSLKDGRLLYSYRSELEEALAEALVVQTEKTVSLHQWHHVTLSYDGSRWASGVKAYVDGEEWKWQILLDDMNEAAPRPQPVRIGSGEGPKNRFQGSIADVRIYNRPLSAIEAAMLANPTSVTEIAALAEDKRSAAQGAKIRDYFLEHAAPAPIKAAWTRTIEVKGRRDAFYDSLPTVQVMEEMPTPRATHVLIRGAYDRPGEKVAPAVPEVLAGSSHGSSPESSGTGPLAGRSCESPHGARHSESVLADVLRDRDREIRREFRFARGAALPSGVARLARDRVRPDRVECQSPPENHRDECDVPAGLERDSSLAGEGPREPSALPRAEQPALSGNDPGPGTRPRRAAGGSHRWAVGQTLPGCRALD